mmetsp:Transcript_37238/g.72659  ORF Transcript_37238/g.72659 Transcript_37238/m.72659 type:complete len:285 (-) Transcript_37238:1132-1986(-)
MVVLYLLLPLSQVLRQVLLRLDARLVQLLVRLPHLPDLVAARRLLDCPLQHGLCAVNHGVEVVVPALFPPAFLHVACDLGRQLVLISVETHLCVLVSALLLVVVGLELREVGAHLPQLLDEGCELGLLLLDRVVDLGNHLGDLLERHLLGLVDVGRLLRHHLELLLHLRSPLYAFLLLELLEELGLVAVPRLENVLRPLKNNLLGHDARELPLKLLDLLCLQLQPVCVLFKLRALQDLDARVPALLPLLIQVLLQLPQLLLLHLQPLQLVLLLAADNHSLLPEH